MARPTIWNKRFDPAASFIVRQPLRINGVAFKRGDPFDKTLVATRRLRQLASARVVEEAPATATASAPVPLKLPTRRARLGPGRPPTQWDIRHVSRGKYAVFKNGERETGPLRTKAECEDDLRSRGIGLVTDAA